MRTWKEINRDLEEKLDPKYVKQHPFSGFDYVEAHYVIQEANKVFGRDGWSNTIVSYEPAYTGIGQDSRGNEQHQICYSAVVEVEVKGLDENGNITSTKRQGSATGSGYSKKAPDAHDSALKSAESDAIKRALKNYGNRFGLALYDDSREGVGSNTTKEQVETFEFLCAELPKWEEDCWVPDDLKGKVAKYKEETESLTDEQVEAFRALFKESMSRVKEKESSA